jgi:hypothetical protein
MPAPSVPQPPAVDQFIAREDDGLLGYLHALHRVAHAPGASHWCTPGHNRGEAFPAAGRHDSRAHDPFPARWLTAPFADLREVP